MPETNYLTFGGRAKHGCQQPSSTSSSRRPVSVSPSLAVYTAMIFPHRHTGEGRYLNSLKKHKKNATGSGGIKNISGRKTMKVIPEQVRHDDNILMIPVF